MIFDSPKMQELREKYSNAPDFLVPEIVFTDRSDKLKNERKYLEDLILDVSEKKQKDWLGRLVNTDHSQYLGAWFELMLFGWLREFGKVEVEPTLHSANPDFAFEINERKIIIEARAIQRLESENEENRLINWIFWALGKIKRSFVVEILAARSTKLPNHDEFISRVDHWLDDPKQEKFVFENKSTTIVLKIYPSNNSSFKKVQAFFASGGHWVNSNQIRNPLREKASKYSAVRNAGFPYIIAIFLEAGTLSAEEVVSVWFGQEKWVFNIEENKVIDSYIDKTGIHFYGNTIRHTTVSGTLVFKADWNEKLKRRFLKAWYVQNPFAKVPIIPSPVPVEAIYGVQERRSSGFRMGWQKSLLEQQ